MPRESQFRSIAFSTRFPSAIDTGLNWRVRLSWFRDHRSSAMAIPAIKGTDSVPGRRPCSWWPPVIKGVNRTP